MKINGSQPGSLTKAIIDTDEKAEKGGTRVQTVIVENTQTETGPRPEGKKLADRTVAAQQTGQTYQKFRHLGQGVTGSVELVHKTPELKDGNKQQDEVDTADTLEAIMARLERKLKVAPDKVPGIREAAEETPPEPVNASELLAKKTFTIRAESEDESTELRLLRKLDHPNIIKLKDAVVESSTDNNGDCLLHIGLMTESGVASLSDVSRKKLNLTAGDTARIMGNTLDGLNYLHSQRVTHNDLKPANIVLSPSLQAKLIDLGSATEFTGTGEPRDSTNSIGTPGYNAPEMDNKRHPRSFYNLKKNDAWAAGCVLYELMTGNPLAKNGEGRLLPEKKINAIPDDLKGWRSEEVQAARRCLKNLLSPRPEDRELKTLADFVEFVQES